MQVLELIILAALAAVVLFQLYAVLGRRVGRGAEEAARAGMLKPARAEPGRAGRHRHPAEPAGDDQARDPSFDVGHFLGGAKAAYQMIVTAFAKGDREALRPLLSPPVMQSFEQVIETREARGPRGDRRIPPSAPRRFRERRGSSATWPGLGALPRRDPRPTKGPEGEAVDDRRTAEVWTFERNLKSRNPNWTLIHVDAAEA